MEYWEVPNLSDYYLEDSWVLDIEREGDSLVLTLDIVLLESHPLSRAPRPGEQYDYRRAKLLFLGVVEMEWIRSGARPATDLFGETDLGSIDRLVVETGVHTIEGDFGVITVRSDAPQIELA